MNFLARRLVSITALSLLTITSCRAPADRQSAGASSGDSRFDFALIGDVPYDEQQITNLFPNMIEEMNHARLAFVVHDGDIKAGAAPCTDQSFERVHALFQTSRHPLIYLFGDNEWSDCGKVKTNAFDPLDRLQKLRELFTQGDRSLGQRTISLTRQSDEPRFVLFRENVRWTHEGVMFAGLNAPGDDNHYGTPEFGPRNAANIALIQETFAMATRENLRAVMLIMQANPHFELAVTNRLRRGFNEMLEVIEKETLAFQKPVVLAHGDSHYFRIDQPLLSSKSRRRIENFTRVETFGNPDVHWLRVSVAPSDPNVFQFHPQHVRKNLLKHQR